MWVVNQHMNSLRFLELHVRPRFFCCFSCLRDNKKVVTLSIDVVGSVFGRLRHATAKPAFPGLCVGLQRGFDSHLLGIIDVCFTVAVTHAVET